jgi:hypothetical protein
MDRIATDGSVIQEHPLSARRFRARARARRHHRREEETGASRADKGCGSEVRQSTLRWSTLRFSALSSGSAFP